VTTFKFDAADGDVRWKANIRGFTNLIVVLSAENKQRQTRD
jgi:hypothetical protein